MAVDVDVSIVVPTYNEGEWLDKTLQFIGRAVTELRYEIVVVDDGCTDGSVSAIEPSTARVLSTDGGRQGSIAARRIGARAAVGRFLCFIDSHVLVTDRWLDLLHETSAACHHRCLVTGTLLNAARWPARPSMHPVYGYTLDSWLLHPTWHHYGDTAQPAPRAVPLCPGGLMYVSREWFDAIGGFETPLREWGREDLDISLRNYLAGGTSMTDPRVLVYHFYKDLEENRPSFSPSWSNCAFNSLFVAKSYFPQRAFLEVRRALAAQANVRPLLEELASGVHDRAIARARSIARRAFDDWTAEFALELTKVIHSAKRPRVQPRQRGYFARRTW